MEFVFLFSVIGIGMFQFYSTWMSFSSSGFSPLFADSVGDVISGYAKYFGDQLVSALKQVFDFLVSKIIDAYNGVKYLLEIVVGALKDGFDFVVEAVEGVIEWCYDILAIAVKWCWDTIWYLLEWCLEFFYYLFDWFIGFLYEYFEYFVEQLPEVNFPQGFEEGLGRFIVYGNILNQMLPMVELFGLLALYFSIFVCVVIYRHVKSFIPII